MRLNIRQIISFKGASKWGRVLRIFFWGLVFGVLAFARQPFSISENAPYFFVYFVFGAYLALILFGEHLENIKGILPIPCLKVMRTTHFWTMALIVLGCTPIFASFLQSNIEVDVSRIYLLWTYMFYVILVMLPCVYSLTILIPSNQYLNSTKINKNQKKKVVDALTVLTPAIGSPWLLAIFSLQPYVNLPPYPAWIDYIIVCITYLLIFFVCIDLPYYISVGEEKTRRIGKLERRRKKLCRQLKEIDKDEARSGWGKIGIELEIARIDRERSEIKSETSHPYRIIIPTVSFLISGILCGLIIEITLQMMRTT